MPKGRHVKFAWDPLLSYFREPQKNDIHILYLHFVCTSFLLLSYFREPQKNEIHILYLHFVFTSFLFIICGILI